MQSPTLAAQWLQSMVPGNLRTDSRQIQPGDGFVAWPGTAVDGRAFVDSALQSGAAACLVEKEGAEAYSFDGTRVSAYAGLKAAAGPIAAAFYRQPSEQLRLFAVTGTNGKTSTAWWLAQAITALRDPVFGKCGLIGTLGVGFAPAVGAEDATTYPDLVATGLTTPDPVMLQQTLRQLADHGAGCCAMEASSIGIEENRLDGTQIRVAIFTNFTQDHLDYHGSMDAYWEAKRKLFSWSGLQCAVLNMDDVRGLELAGSLAGSGLDIWTISTVQPARLQARAIGFHDGGMRFTVAEGDAEQLLETSLIGSYNISNLLGVIATLRSQGVSLARAVAVCASLQAVPGRMECHGMPGQPLIAVDYAHTPDALDHALQALRPMVQARGGKLWCVFGCGGDRDTSKRPLMGAVAGKLADRVVVTSDNPRSERPEAIISQILLGLPHGDSVQVETDRANAIAATIALAAPSDVVLIAGKGHEDVQEVRGVKTAFSDRLHARAALQRRQDRVAEVRA